MASFIKAKLRAAAGGIVAVGLTLGALGAPAFAQDSRTVPAERYNPGIWIDPDGCEHWAMDDGAEGFMGPRRMRDGRPVCHRSEICGVVPTDTLFATDRYNISAAGRERLRQFFSQANAFGFLIYGHTDSRASDEYNITLSNNRARAVAQVAQGIGARVVDVRGFGERQPKASNATAAGMQLNRRVEIYCLR
ncbi:OmpA family protein [Limimaricola cinnabarinus]|uniref:OmpA family protein n=1 Tax=Limimaricola cinnabarinus TaxID=1125964 RepID=UPI002FE14FE1